MRLKSINLEEDHACNVYNNLCGSELNVVLDQLNETQNSNKNLLIAGNWKMNGLSPPKKKL